MFLNLSDKALVDLHKALYFNKKFFKDSLQNLSNIYANIGYYNIQQFKHTDSVIIYYDKANKINEKYGDYYAISNNLYSFALTFLTNNTNVSHIDSLLKEALDYAKKTNQTDFFIKCYFHIINIYRHFKNFQNADELLTTKDYNKIIIESNDKETSQEYYMHVALIKWSLNHFYDGILYSIKAININPNPKTRTS